MNRWWLDIELLDDVVFSRRSGTAGAHESLDRIPGSSLRGWSAAHLYDALGDQAWEAFHSGRIRWLDGLPADRNGHRCLPVPLSWHVDKSRPDAPAQRNGHWMSSHLHNLAAGVPPDRAGFQPKGLRSGYVAPTGQAIEPCKRYRLMTAIGADGVVAEGQLFGYESLAEGQRFVAALEADSVVPDEIVNRVLHSLEGVLRLGRSRSAHYGRAQVQIRPSMDKEELPVIVGTDLHVLLVSDACLRDAWGQPTFTPDADALGLADVDGIRLCLDRTFLRARRFSGWNARRDGPELERHVLQAGGVLTLQSEQGWPVELLERLQRGIGADRALGFGEIHLHPAWLHQPTPSFESTVTDPMEQPVAKPRPDTALLRSLSRLASRDLGGFAKTQFVQQALRQLASRWLAVRRYRAVLSHAEWGPSATQWGALSQRGAAAHTVADLRQTVASELDGKPEWSDEIPGPDGLSLSLRRWALDTLQALSDDPSLQNEAVRLDTWQRLCDEVRRHQLHLGEAALKSLIATAQAAAR